MNDSSLIVLPYENGNVSVVKMSRIKVYTFRGSIKGFLFSYDASGVSILEPRNYRDFDSPYSKDVQGKIRKVSLSQLSGYAYYPEVSVLETISTEVS